MFVEETKKLSYRPTRFQDVIGQDIAIKLIQFALKENKLPHSVILYGPSGVGKTTIARLIAAWYVCVNKQEYNVDGELRVDVCGVCDMCRAVQDGSISDIIEFDAASNTSIEDIREILDQCNYAPQYSSVKLFIIDEAHMLSRNAIAALLKTLEESRAHIRFILATTELEKISDAIKSRCLCIGMHDIKLHVMINYFNSFAEYNKITIDDDAKKLLVRLSNGSMRQAISILNQAMLLSDNIESKILHMIVGYIPDDEIKIIVNYLYEGLFEEIFAKMNNLLEQGNISALSVLQQIMDYIKYLVQENFNDDKISGNKTNVDKNIVKEYLKILIDLNKLAQDSARISSFSEHIIISLAEIAYYRKN